MGQKSLWSTAWGPTAAMSPLPWATQAAAVCWNKSQHQDAESQTDVFSAGLPMWNELPKEIRMMQTIINLQVCCKILFLISAVPLERAENPSSTEGTQGTEWFLDDTWYRKPCDRERFWLAKQYNHNSVSQGRQTNREVGPQFTKQHNRCIKNVIKNNRPLVLAAHFARSLHDASEIKSYQVFLKQLDCGKTFSVPNQRHLSFRENQLTLGSKEVWNNCSGI